MVDAVSTINVGYYGLLQLNTPNHTLYVEGDHLKMCLKMYGYPTTVFNKDRQTAKSITFKKNMFSIYLTHAVRVEKPDS